MLDVTVHVNALAEEVHALLQERDRILVAIAGPPGCGKSTLAGELARRLRLQRVPTEVVSLDGFLLDNAVLEARGLKLRKGAPESHDAGGFLHLVSRLRTGEEVVAPVYDRARDVAVANALAVPADCPVVVLEGSYLMFDEPPWVDLAPAWDVSARIDVPMEELRGRLIQRWLTLGLSRTAATRRAMLNDVPNAERVIARALPTDFALRFRPAG